MTSAVRRKYYGSVTLLYLDKQEVGKAIQKFVDELSKGEEVLEVIPFGSWARGETKVGSDEDFLIVFRESSLPFLDRVPEYVPVDFPLDVFPYTVDEIRSGHPLAERAYKEGRVIFRRVDLCEGSV